MLKLKQVKNFYGEFMETVGSRIFALMKSEGLTQKELATGAGVTESTLSRYIRNERQPSAQILANIATALNTTLDYLLHGKNDKLDFQEVYRFVARASKDLTQSQKMEVLKVLLND